MNEEVRQRFYTRARIINYVRKFLDNMGFLEVETPMMNMVCTIVPTQVDKNAAPQPTCTSTIVSLTISPITV